MCIPKRIDHIAYINRDVAVFSYINGMIAAAERGLHEIKDKRFDEHSYVIKGNWIIMQVESTDYPNITRNSI